MSITASEQEAAFQGKALAPVPHSPTIIESVDNLFKLASIKFGRTGSGFEVLADPERNEQNEVTGFIVRRGSATLEVSELPVRGDRPPHITAGWSASSSPRVESRSYREAVCLMGQFRKLRFSPA
ncbi:MAG: hypothetical protein WDO70_04265 [Alphaproteobacteria bacterium]